MSTPIEEGAEAVHRALPLASARACRKATTAVFGSIDREGLADAIESFGIDWEMGSRKQPLADYQADAIIAWLNGGDA